MKKYILTLSLVFLAMAGFAQINVFQEKGKYGMTVGGKKVLKAKYEKITADGSYSQGEHKNFVVVQQNGLWGFFNTKGKQITPIKYEDYNFNMFYGGLAGVKSNGLWGFVDMKGVEVIPFKYERILSFGMDSSTAVQLNGLWGFIDKTGAEILPFKYEGATSFYKEGASVKLDGKWGFIDKTGKMLIYPKFDEYISFIGETAHVKLYGRKIYIDKTGKEVDEPEIYKSSSGSSSSSSSGNNSSQKAVNWKCSQCGETKMSVDRPISGSGGCRHLDNQGRKQNGSHKWTK